VAHQRHPSRVAAERSDVLLDPAQSGGHVQQRIVARSIAVAAVEKSCADNFTSLPPAYQCFSFSVTFYPRDAMLAGVLAMALCLSVCVCLSVTSRCSIEMDE